MTVLAGRDAARRETLPVADAIDVVDDRNFWIARQQEIGVHGVWRAAGIDGTYRRDESLTDDLAPKNPLPADLGRTAAEQIHFERFEIENIEQVLHGRRHEKARNSQRVPSTCYAATGFTRNARWISGAKVIGPRLSSVGLVLPAWRWQSRCGRG